MYLKFVPYMLYRFIQIYIYKNRQPKKEKKIIGSYGLSNRVYTQGGERLNLSGQDGEKGNIIKKMDGHVRLGILHQGPYAGLQKVKWFVSYEG
jgi:hypothetical protein